MRKVYTISLIFMAVMFLAMPIAAQENLLENPGFEAEGYDGINSASDWDIWMGERLSELRRTGSWSLHGWGFDGDGDNGGWQGIFITPGTKFCFSGYLISPNEGGHHKSPLAGGAEAFLEIEWWQGDVKLSSARSSSLTGASDWKLYSVTDTAPTDADSVRFVVKTQSVPGSSGDVYFDDLKVMIIE